MTNRKFQKYLVRFDGIGQDQDGPFILIRIYRSTDDGKSGTTGATKKMRPGEWLRLKAHTETRTYVEEYEKD